MRFIHTADWQIGMKAVHVGAAGNAVRSVRLQGLSQVLNVAKEQQGQFMLVAGDIFENNNVDRSLVQAVADILQTSPCPVFIIPGNHDPYCSSSVWQHPAWKSCEPVTLILQATPIAVPNGTLYPCPLYTAHGREDPTRWIEKVPKNQGIHIGLAHGSLQGICTDATDFPISASAAKDCGLNYLALGHWHSTTVIQDPKTSACLAYSGTHEISKFGERDSGNVLVVEINDHTKQVQVSPHRTGALEWIQIIQETSPGGTLQQLRKMIEQNCKKETSLVSLILQGVLQSDERDDLLHLEDLLSARTLFHQLDIRGLHPPPEDSSWITELPMGVLREAAMRLQTLEKLTPSSGIPPNILPELSTLALLELYSLSSRLQTSEQKPEQKTEVGA